MVGNTINSDRNVPSWALTGGTAGARSTITFEFFDAPTTGDLTIRYQIFQLTGITVTQSEVSFDPSSVTSGTATVTAVADTAKTSLWHRGNEWSDGSNYEERRVEHMVLTNSTTVTVNVRGDQSASPSTFTKQFYLVEHTDDEVVRGTMALASGTNSGTAAFTEVANPMVLSSSDMLANRYETASAAAGLGHQVTAVEIDSGTPDGITVYRHTYDTAAINAVWQVVDWLGAAAVTRDPPQADLTISTVAPTTTVSANLTALPPQADLTISTVAPVPVIAWLKNAPQADLIISTAAPTSVVPSHIRQQAFRFREDGPIGIPL